MSHGGSDPYRTVAEALRTSMEDGAAINEPLKVIVLSLAKEAEAQQVTRKQFEAGEPLYDKSGAINAELILAFNAARCCESLFEAHQNHFAKYKEAISTFMQVRFMLEPGVIVNLYNARELLLDKSSLPALTEKTRDAIAQVFGDLFLKLTQARHSLVHLHDRATGRAYGKVVSSVGQSGRSTRNGIADLVDIDGHQFGFDFSSDRVLKLVTGISDLLRLV